MINNDYMVNQFFVSVIIIFSVAFYTLMERKILSYQQNRKGPNKIGMGGMIQPASDAVKLLSKKEFSLTFSNNILYWWPPLVSFYVLIMMIQLLPNKMGLMEFNLSMIYFICLIALTGYSTILMGWSSNSKFTVIGSLRALAQNISYEVLMMLSIVVFLVLLNTFDLYTLMTKEKGVYMMIMWLLIVVTCISLICEVNRAPFDLSEGESELVSGFNTEYGMTKFSLIFLSEYGMMIFMSFILILFFNTHAMLLMLMKSLTIMMVFLWLRASYPRLRYDMLMYFTWKNLLSMLVFLSLYIYMIL